MSGLPIGTINEAVFRTTLRIGRNIGALCRAVRQDGTCHFQPGRGVLVIYIAIVVLISAATGLVVLDARRNAFQNEQRDNTNLAIALAEQTARYVQTVDLAILEVKSWAAEADRLTPATFLNRMQSAEVHQRLMESQSIALKGHAIIVVDADGVVLNTSRLGFIPGLNVTDRDYFNYLKHHEDTALIISSPAIGKITGYPSLFFARRVSSPDGAFLGLVVASVDVAYLSKFYRSISERLGGTVTLLSQEGTILVRCPDPTSVAGEKIPDGAVWYSRVAEGGGHYRSQGLLDGVPSLVVVQALRDYPLVVDVTTPEAVMLQPWRRQATYTAIGALLVALGFIVLTHVIARQFQRQRHQNAMLRQSAADLLESEQKVRRFAEMASDWFWEQGPDLRFLGDAKIPLTTLPTDVGKTRWDLADTAMNPQRWDAHKADLAARRPFRDFRWERIQTDGKRRYMSTSGDPIFLQTGDFVGYQGTGRDITADVQAAEELRLAKDQAESANRANADLVTAVSFANDALIGLSADCTINTWNPAAERLYRLRAEEIIGQNISSLWPVAQRARLNAALRKAGGGDLISNLETFHENPDGHIIQISISAAPVLASDGAVTGLIVTGRDITEHKRFQERILHLAHYDALTGLPNRTLLNDRLSLALNHAARDGGTLAVLALDLNRFKAINDGFGHAAGDMVLATVADRLKDAMRAADTLARIGGDTFIVLQTNVEPAVVSEIAQRLIEVLSEPFELNQLQIRIGASIGIALYPEDGESAEALLKNADTALYRAKVDRHGTFRFFEAEMEVQLRDRWALEQDLRSAIGTDQLRVHYQPIFASATRSISGFEALLRWNHPVRGNIPPASFIPIAEETGLILTIGSWVLEEACRTAAGWATPKRIAVNLSASQLRGSDLLGQVADVLRRTGLPARMLELEVTETILVSDHCEALETLQLVRDLGVQIACDDFGTGYSSFSYIQNLSFDRIKIDRSFVQKLGVTPSALRIVQAILAMAHSLGIETTAEGVETEQQFSILRAQDCDEMQGFLLGRPMPASAISEVLYVKERT